MGALPGRVDLVGAAIITVDLNGVITSANPTVEALYGWRPEELVGHPAADFAAMAVTPAVQEEIGQAIAKGQPWEGTFDVRRKDGSTVAVRAIDIPMQDQTGGLVAILSVGLDASTNAAIEVQLEEQTRTASVFEFLTECTTALSSALDYEEALRRLGRLSADFIGDVCLIDIWDGPAVRRVVAVHKDPARQPIVDGLIDFLPDPTGRHPSIRALQAGQATYSETMSEDFLASTTRDQVHLDLVRTLGFQSFVCVPLTARGRILGSLTLVSCRPERRFGPADLGLVQELGWRAALALDNARAFEERNRVTRVLQASLLPPSLPTIHGASLAARYVAAEEGLDVGGDFYDVFDAGYGTWGVAIGDVCGRGPRAATVTGLIRHTLRSLALRERHPGRLVEGVNHVLHRDLDDPTMFSTLWYAMMRPRPEGLSLRYANGGHPPAVVLRNDGTVDELPGSGLFLGPFEAGVWAASSALLRPGDTVVLFTDGVTEARHGIDQFGDGPFQEVLAGLAGATPDAIADALTTQAAAFADASLPDDMAVLVIQAT